MLNLQTKNWSQLLNLFINEEDLLLLEAWILWLPWFFIFHSAHCLWPNIGCNRIWWQKWVLGYEQFFMTLQIGNVPSGWQIQIMSVCFGSVKGRSHLWAMWCSGLWREPPALVAMPSNNITPSGPVLGSCWVLWRTSGSSSGSIQFHKTWYPRSSSGLVLWKKKFWFWFCFQATLLWTCSFVAQNPMFSKNVGICQIRSLWQLPSWGAFFLFRLHENSIWQYF